MSQEVLAVVAGEEITQAEFDAFLQGVPREQQPYLSNPQFREQCLEQLIALHMFAKNGEEMKLEETEEFKKLVESARRDILAQMAMRETLKDVVVSEEEIEAYYEANKQHFTKGDTVSAKHILTDSEEKCNSILESITTGEKEFETAAKEFSTCPSGAKGRRPWRIRTRTDGKRIRRCGICSRNWTCSGTCKDTVWIPLD